jgi:DNA repair exonuclease SbcCD ATPase subunit
MSTEISPEGGYAAEQRQAELDTIELHISHDNTNVEQIETLIAQLKDRQDAAKELLRAAERALEKPREPGMACDFHAAPTRDKRTAEAVLAECTEKISFAQERLQRVKARRAQWEARKKEFSDDSLRAKRQLEALRNRLRS